MIKPATLWALCKTCTDSKWIGDVCRALGGQDVQLDFGQLQAYNAIQTDSGWMDERIEWEKEANRKRVAAYRERQKAERDGCNGVIITSLRNGHVMPSVPPSLPPSVQEDDMCVSRPRTCEKEPPTLEAVILYGKADFRRDPPEVIPESFCREWYARLANSEPPWHNTRGNSVLANWKMSLEFSWKNSKQFSATGTQGVCKAVGHDGIRRGTFAPQTENKRGLD